MSLPHRISPIMGALLLIMFAPTAGASPAAFNGGRAMSVEEVWQAAAASSQVQADQLATEVEEGKADLLQRVVRRPRFQAEAQMIWRDRERESATPFGLQNYGQNRDALGGLSVSQNLWVPEQELGGLQAARLKSKARRAQHSQLRADLAYQVAQLSVEHHRLQETLKWMQASLKNLRSQSEDVRRLALMSRAGPSDQLRMQVEIGSLEQDRLRVESDALRLLEQIRSFVPEFRGLSVVKTSRTKSEMKSVYPIEKLRQLEDLRNQLETSQSSIRPEADVFKFNAEAYLQEARSQRAAWWPTLQAEGRWVYADQGLLQTKQWGELTLKAQWSIYEGGARARSGAMAELGARAQDHLRDAQDRQWRADREAVREQLKSLVERSRWVAETEKLSDSALSMERRRLREGRLSLERYLEAERSALRVLRQRLDLEAEVLGLELRMRWLLSRDLEQSMQQSM
jgi:outer membrane protein TolC